MNNYFSATLRQHICKYSAGRRGHDIDCAWYNLAEVHVTLAATTEHLKGGKNVFKSPSLRLHECASKSLGRWETKNEESTQNSRGRNFTQFHHYKKLREVVPLMAEVGEQSSVPGIRWINTDLLADREIKHKHSTARHALLPLAVQTSGTGYFPWTQRWTGSSWTVRRSRCGERGSGEVHNS